MTHRFRKYADWAGITRSLTETRPTQPHRLLTAGVDLKTVSGRFGHAEALITLKFYAQFARPPDPQVSSIAHQFPSGLLAWVAREPYAGPNNTTTAKSSVVELVRLTCGQRTEPILARRPPSDRRVRALPVNRPRAMRVRPHAQISTARVLDILGTAFTRVGEATRVTALAIWRSCGSAP